MDVTEHIKHTMKPMEPIVPPNVEAMLPAMDRIEAVVFDIYGTLLISAAGDISLSEETSSETAMEKIKAMFPEVTVRVKAKQLTTLYSECLECDLQKRREEGVEYPEVEIREVWREVFDRAGVGGVSVGTLEEIAIVYECAVNPVWLMPGVTELLDSIRSAGIPMGIISNAQFYTRPLFEALLGSTFDQVGFKPDWQTYSFCEGEGKPSVHLYEKARKQILSDGIDADRIFYLGNDLRKDIIPAQAVGFQTGLFAGDARSLRLHGRSFPEAAQLAGAVLTELTQVSEVCQFN